MRCFSNFVALFWIYKKRFKDRIDSKLEEASKLFGDLDIIINNAGVWTGKEWYEITKKRLENI